MSDLSDSPGEPAQDLAPWIAGHLYHADLDRVVRRFVRPLVVDLEAEGGITGFFFIRYGLGGPHVRLRLRPTRGAEGQAMDRMERYADVFLANEPSRRSVDEESIRLSNEATLENDPNEVDPSVYPDNSFHVQPFRPEVERYGGPDRIGLSLDFFTLSSLAVLEHLSGLEDVPRSVRLAKATGLLLRQALGFAADEDELAGLLRYGVDWLGSDLPKIAEKGTVVAQSSLPRFLGLFDESFADTRALISQSDLTGLSPRDLFVIGARSLSRALGDADRATRLRIGASQIHMTASRLGLNNAEEVYLSQILSLTLAEAQTSSARDLSELCRARSPWSVRELLPAALKALVALESNG